MRDDFPKLPVFFIAWSIFCAVISLVTVAGFFFLANKAIEVLGHG